MTETFLIAQGDTKPMDAVLTYGGADVPPEDRPVVDPSPASSVTLLVAPASLPVGPPVLSRDASVVGQAVRYVWQPLDSQGLEPGVYYGQFRVAFPEGPATFPDDDPIRIIVTPSLAP